MWGREGRKKKMKKRLVTKVFARGRSAFFAVIRVFGVFSDSGAFVVEEEGDGAACEGYKGK